MVSDLRATTPMVGLYQGTTWHGRRGPVANDFRYRVWSVLVDLDDLPSLAGRYRLLRVDAPGLATLRSLDHVLPLDAVAVRAWLAERDVELEGGSIRLLTSPRFLGAVFNPLSVWWCFDRHGVLAAVVAEVHNTYGGRHAYLLRPDASGRAGTGKRLYVSPFNPVEGHYVLRLSTDVDRFAVHIGYERDGRRVFDATWTGRHEPLSDRTLLSMLWRNPLWSLRVTALIHWQGLRLWLRRLRVFPRRRADHHDIPTPRGRPNSGAPGHPGAENDLSAGASR